MYSQMTSQKLMVRTPPSWTHAMYHQDYNQHIKTPHRITDWRDGKDVIMPILERSQAA